MDLHAWITQQVERVEAAARARLVGRPVNLAVSGSDDVITGTITEVGGASDGLRFTVARYGVEPVDSRPAPVDLVSAVLRRCEADRRILARHRLDPASGQSPTFATACEGCGHEWMQDDPVPFVDNLNDCPELLDLAHAHGITDEILAGLDRPEPPEPQPRDGRRLGLGDILATPPITTGDVPAALRGPRWKP